MSHTITLESNPSPVMGQPVPEKSPRYGTRSITKGEETPKQIPEMDASSSSPLSSINTPEKSPIKQPVSVASPPKPRIILRFNTRKKPPINISNTPETVQTSSKRKRTTTAQPAISAKKLKPTPASKKTATKVLPAKARINISFSEAAIVGYALRQMYDAIPDLPEEELKLKWVPVEKRRQVFDLVQRLVDYWELTEEVCTRYHPHNQWYSLTSYSAISLMKSVLSN